jgi:hypothetical protein
LEHGRCSGQNFGRILAEGIGVSELGVSTPGILYGCEKEEATGRGVGKVVKTKGGLTSIPPPRVFWLKSAEPAGNMVFDALRGAEECGSV